MKNTPRILEASSAFIAFLFAVTCVVPTHAASFTYTGSLNAARQGHAATLLTNGKVLVSGGGAPAASSSVQLYDPATGTWIATGSFLARVGHSQARLPDGKVLAVSGVPNGSMAFASAQLYDPITGVWSHTTPINIARVNNPTVVLADGRVMLPGGYNRGTPLMASVEIYDPSTANWSFTGALTGSRQDHTGTLLLNGKVLVAGGSGQTSVLADAQLYDPATGTWTPTGSMSVPRRRHSATLLSNGKVLVAGGTTAGPGYSTYHATAELYDPASGTWTPTGSMPGPRFNHEDVLLCNGRVLVTGGNDATTILSSAVLYHPASGVWTTTAPMNVPRVGHTMTVLPNGQVLVAAGRDLAGYLASTELYTDSGCATISTWTFTDQGFIAGGQGGALRTYNEPASVAASPWSFQSPCRDSLRISFENDLNCAGYNGYNQIGTAQATITVGCPTRMYVNWSGMGEQKDPSPQNPQTYEKMRLFVNSVFHGEAHSPGGGLECGAPMAPVVSNPAPPQYVDLSPGTHTLRIETETFDEKYHIGAYYQFDLDFEPIP